MDEKKWKGQILDMSFVNKHTKKTKPLDRLKVHLKKGKKGVGLFASKTIRKDEVIAYYKIQIFSVDDPDPFRGKYTIAVYSKKNKMYQHLVGNLSPTSLQPPRYSIPYWAYFSNEPSKEEDENSYLDINLKENYQKRDSIKKGDSLIYKLRALTTIKKNEEIMWCYGDSYHRNYKTSCED